MRSHYVVSALRKDSSQLGHLKQFLTRKEAIEHAKNIIKSRRESQASEMTFYVLKVCVSVGVEGLPIKVIKLK